MEKLKNLPKIRKIGKNQKKILDFLFHQEDPNKYFSIHEILDTLDKTVKHRYKITVESLNILHNNNLIEKRIETFKSKGDNGGKRWSAYYRMNETNRLLFNLTESSRQYNSSFKMIKGVLDII